MTDLYNSLRQQQSNNIPRDLKYTINAMYRYWLCTAQFKLETVNLVHSSASNYQSCVHKQRPPAWLVNNVTFNKDCKLNFASSTSCEKKHMYCNPRNVTFAHTEPNKMFRSMLKIHEKYPTFKINANHGPKNGNLNLINPNVPEKLWLE